MSRQSRNANVHRRLSRCRPITRPHTWAEVLADYESEHANMSARKCAGLPVSPHCWRLSALRHRQLMPKANVMTTSFGSRERQLAAASEILSANEAALGAASSFHDL